MPLQQIIPELLTQLGQTPELLPDEELLDVVVMHVIVGSFSVKISSGFGASGR